MQTRFLYFLLLLLPTGLFAQSFPANFFANTDSFLQTYVRKGVVHYAEIQQDPAQLPTLIRQIEGAKLETMPPPVRKAFLLNAYNLLVIQGVLQAYPISSPQQVGGFFEQKSFLVAGEKQSLNGLEKEVLLAEFPDPRLHFALVCGANGCPRLRSEVYSPDSLDQLLERQTREALNDPAFVQIDHAEQTVSLSQIFQWYEKDFQKEAEDALAYVNGYRNTPLPAAYRLRWYEYDWSLNEPLPDPRSLLDQSGGKTNLQIYTPSVLLRKGQIRFQMFHNIYTQTGFRNGKGRFVDLERRETFYTGIFRLDLGITRNSRWNLGLEGNLQGVRYDSQTGSSPLRYFSATENDLLAQRTALTNLGPRLRVQPFASVPNLSITSIFYFPLAKDLERDEDFGFLSHNRASWWTQLFYDKTWGKYQLFLEFDFLYRFKTQQHSFRQEAFFRTPMVVFLSYFPTPKTTLNINYQFSPAFTGLPGNENGTPFGPVSAFMQAGAGAKYQLTPAINLEVLYTNFFASWGEGAGQTFNLGVVFIR